MSSRAKVSILVPIYNVEDYLEECLDSLVSQTLKEIEIVCINDGSKDESLKIVKEYAKKDKRFVIIDKDNSGYGDSMNCGLKKATGEYIGIVEPDDFIELNAFERLYKIAKNNDAEVVKSNFYEYSTEKHGDIGKSDMFSSKDVGRVIDPRKNQHIFYVQPSIWSAIFKNSFLKNNEIEFLPTPGASYQDAGFSFKVWASARRVYLVDEAFLHYRQDNPNSSVKSDGKIFAVKDEYDEVERFLKEKKLMNEYGYTLAIMRFSSYIWNMKRLTTRAAREFGREVKKDYIRIKNEGFLDDSKMDKVGRQNAKDLAIKHPNVYILLRPLHERRNKIRKIVPKIIGRVSPSYRQKKATVKLVQELEQAQIELEEKIEKLEDMIDRGRK